jgi:hypothetical protein
MGVFFPEPAILRKRELTCGKTPPSFFIRLTVWKGRGGGEVVRGQQNLERFE